MLKSVFYLFTQLILYCHIKCSNCEIYTYEDVELRRIFPSEFPQDTIRKSGVLDPEHLGRYNELSNYFKYPKSKLNSHFEELDCYNENGRKWNELYVFRKAGITNIFEINIAISPIFKEQVTLHGEAVCIIDTNQYSPDEEQYMASDLTSYTDRRRIYCFMLLCFTEDELDRVVASF